MILPNSLHQYFLPLLLLTLQPTTAHPAPPLSPPTTNINSPSLRLTQPISSPLHCIPGSPFELPPINPQTCLTHTIPAICAKLTFPFPPRGIWQWSSYPSCTMGFYLPPTLARGEGIPTLPDCINIVFGEMVSKCVMGSQEQGKGGAGLGMRNVKRLPTERDVGLGVVEGRARFLMGGRRIDGLV